MGKNKGMFIPHEFARSVWRLSDEDAGLLLKACFDYFEGFTEAEVADSIKEIWAEFKASFEEEARRYEAKCAKNRACIMQRWKTKDTNVLRTYYERTNQESERERDGDEEKRSKREEEEEKVKGKEKCVRASQFVPPTLAQVKEYVEENGLKMDAEHFYDHFASNGWKVSGRATMKDWRAAVRNWARNETKYDKQRTAHGTSVGERAYNMLHFEYEGHPEKWIEEEKKIAELQKYF